MEMKRICEATSTISDIIQILEFCSISNSCEGCLYENISSCSNTLKIETLHYLKDYYKNIKQYLEECYSSIENGERPVRGARIWMNKLGIIRDDLYENKPTPMKSLKTVIEALEKITANSIEETYESEIHYLMLDSLCYLKEYRDLWKSVPENIKISQ